MWVKNDKVGVRELLDRMAEWNGRDKIMQTEVDLLMDNENGSIEVG